MCFHTINSLRARSNSSHLSGGNDLGKSITKLLSFGVQKFNEQRTPHLKTKNKSGGTWDFFPYFGNVYRGLIERLIASGFTKNEDLFIAHYDWRQSNNESATEFLKPIIYQAKQVSGANKVDLVAHSMGGLVARAYIQGPAYEDDVDQLITLGTPHYGAADAYMAWEGGTFPENWSPLIKLYTSLVEDSLQVAHQTLLTRPASFRTYFPFLHDLLPTTDFVSLDNAPIANNDLATHNLFLAELNDDLDDLKNSIDLTTMAGTGFDTLDHINLTSSPSLLIQTLDNFLNRWRDGHPIPDPPEADTTAGDQTVTVASARLNNSDPVQSVKHDKLPEELQEEVVEALGADLAGPHLTYDLPETVLGTVILSPIEVAINGPNGEVLSPNTNTFPDAQYLIDDAQLIILSNPPEGLYTLTYTGTDEGEYTIITSFADDDETTSFTFDGTTSEDEQFTKQIYIGDNTSSLIDDTDYKELLKQIITLAKQAKKDKLIKGYEKANLTRPVIHARNDLRIYKKRLKKDRKESALSRLEDYYEELDEIEKSARKIAGKNNRADFARAIIQLIQKIRRYSPPL